MHKYNQRNYLETHGSPEKDLLIRIRKGLAALAAGDSLAILQWAVPRKLRLSLEAYALDGSLACRTNPEASVDLNGNPVDRFSTWLRSLERILADRGMPDLDRRGALSYFDNLISAYANASGSERNVLDISLYSVRPIATHPDDTARTQRYHFDPGVDNGVRCISTLVGNEGSLFVREAAYDRNLALELAHQELDLIRRCRCASSKGESTDHLLKCRDEIQLRIHGLASESPKERLLVGRLGIFRIGQVRPLLHTSEPNPARARLVLRIDGASVSLQ